LRHSSKKIKRDEKPKDKKEKSMKKRILFVVALLNMAPTTAYKLTIDNDSEKQVELRVSFRKPKRNPMAKIKLIPGQKKVYKHGVRCIAGLTVIPRSGTGPKGPFGPFDAPKLTGSGYSCASNDIRIIDVPNGGLVIEDAQKAKRGQFIFVKNKTSYPLQVKIEYFNMGICPIEYTSVKPDGTLIHKTGRGHGVYPGALARCCATKINIRTTEGPALARKWHTFEPKHTGLFQMQSCRDNTVTVEVNPDGSLNLEGE
jgi:hypothetical protein